MTSSVGVDRWNARGSVPAFPRVLVFVMELVHTRSFQMREEAKLALFEYIEVFYNRRRRHSSLGYVSPAEYERTAEVQRQAA